MNDPRPGESNEPDEVCDERLSGLYRATRAAEPPAWLDQRVLTAARTAVEPRPPPVTPLPRRRGPRFWAPPVALAATVALVVGGLLRLPPLVGEPDGTPTALAEKTLRALAQPAAERDAARTESVQPAAPATAAPPPLPQSVPAARSPVLAPRLPELLRQNEGKADIHDLTIRRSPTAWRAEIAELRRQGQNAEAEARLAEFRRQYPHEPLNDAEPPP